MIGDDDNSRLPEVTSDFCNSGWDVGAYIPDESSQPPETQNSTNTHLYHIVHAAVFKSKLQAAEHYVSSNQFFTHLRTICSQVLPQFPLFYFIFNKFIYLFIFGCVGSSLLRLGLSQVAASGGRSLLRCGVFSLRWLLLLQSTGSQCTGFRSCGSLALERRLSSCGARA